MNKRYYAFSALILIIIIGILLRVTLLGSDFSGDEIDFVKGASAIVQTGHPTFYHSEQEPKVTALWHPPMYLYELAFFFKLFSISEISARMLNFTFVLITGILIFLFCKINLKRDCSGIIGLMAATLFYIDYYCFSSSMIIDIDVFSTFFIFCFIFAVYLYLKDNSLKNLFLVGLSFFFSLWNRYPIAFIVYLSLGVYILVTERKKFVHYLTAGFSAGLVFLAIWGAYNIFLEPGNFFSFIVHNAKLGGTQLSSLSVYSLSFVLNIVQLARLVTVPGIILLILTALYFFKRKEKMIRVLMISSLSIIFLFIFLPRPAFGYPRYFLSAFPGIWILVSICVYENYKKTFLQKRELGVIALATVFSFVLLVIISPELTLYRTDGLIRATNLPDFILNLFCIAPILLTFLIDKKRRFYFLIVILFVLTLSFSLYFDCKLALNDSKIKETGYYLKSNTSPQDKIVAPKAVAYYAERKFFGNDENKPPIKQISPSFLMEYIVKSARNKNMDEEFFYGRGYFQGLNFPKPPIEDLESSVYVVSYYRLENVEPEKKVGEFYIYKTEEIARE
jgi:4-amino-4-deoxy-L-arabinose transferase-like glycosyltransferase